MKSAPTTISQFLLVFIWFVGGFQSAAANVVPAAICNNMTATQCAIKVKSILSDVSTSPEEALEAWGAWSEVYERAYRTMPNAPKPPDDLDRFEDAVGTKIDSYTKPENIALDLAIARYFPRLAAILSLPETPIIAAVMVFLAPSPIVTPIQELQSTNNELSGLLILKIGPLLDSNWRGNFGTGIQQALDGGKLGPKP